jgi:hypothetical protein
VEDDWSVPESPVEQDPVDPAQNEQAFRLIVRLGQPFGALLVAQQLSGEYKRIALDDNIITQVRDVTPVDNMMDVRALEIL